MRGIRIAKAMLAAIGLIAALGALPALAAAQPAVDAPGEGDFTVAGGAVLLQAQANTECSGSSGSGQFTSETTGSVELTFIGCGEYAEISLTMDMKATFSEGEIPE